VQQWSQEPSTKPSDEPSSMPSLSPSDEPSAQPSLNPSDEPSAEPSTMPSQEPSTKPSDKPSSVPSVSPRDEPSSEPSLNPSGDDGTLWRICYVAATQQKRYKKTARSGSKSGAGSLPTNKVNNSREANRSQAGDNKPLNQDVRDYSNYHECNQCS